MGRTTSHEGQMQTGSHKDFWAQTPLHVIPAKLKEPSNPSEPTKDLLLRRHPLQSPLAPTTAHTSLCQRIEETSMKWPWDSWPLALGSRQSPPMVGQ